MNIKEAIQAFKDYMTSKENPGHVTADQLGIYSKDVLNTKLESYLSDTSFKISKYGDNNWCPPDILGSFEGGYRSTDKFYFGACQEPNGDISLIENATNGIITGAYYTFLELQPDGSYTLNPTPQRFRVPALEALVPGRRVSEICNSDGDGVLWGRFKDPDGTIQPWVVLTGGTTNPNAQRASMLTFTTTTNTRAVLVGQYVYFLTINGENTIIVSRVAASSIGTGPVTPELVTGWETTGILSKVFTGDLIQYTDSLWSKDPNANAAFLIDSRLSNPMAYTNRQLTVAHPTENRLRMLHQQPIWVTSDAGAGRVGVLTLLFDINFDTKKCVVVSPTNTPAQILTTDGKDVIQAPEQANITAEFGPMDAQLEGTAIMLSNGDMVRFTYDALTAGYWDLTQTIRDPAMINFDRLWPGLWSFRNIGGQGMFRRFGSLFGSSAIFRGWMPGNHQLFQALTTDPGNPNTPPGYNEIVVTPTSAHDAFIFHTDSGDYPGYEPTPDIKGVTISPNTMNGCMLMTGPDRKIVKVTGGTVAPQIYIEGNYKEIILDGTTIKNSGKGTITAGNDAFTTLVNKAKSDEIANYALSPTAELEVAYELWIPPSGGAREYLPVAFVTLRDKSTTLARLLYYTVTLTWSSGDIVNGGVISNIIPTATEITRSTVAPGINVSWFTQGHGFVYEHFQNGVYSHSIIFLPFQAGWRTSGGDSNSRLELVISAGDQTYTRSRLRTSSSWYTAQFDLTLLEGYGPISIDRNYLGKYSGCSVWYRKYSLDAGIDAYWNSEYTPGPNNYYILGSSQVAEGYQVYFTNDTPCLINTKYYLVKATAMNLKDIAPDPSNKTFYVWLKLENDVVSYVITANQSEVHDLYIGKITTNQTQIDNIDIVKATVFDW